MCMKGVKGVGCQEMIRRKYVIAVGVQDLQALCLW
jgi:hypothetical protein